jgi:hypothetical protein
MWLGGLDSNQDNQIQNLMYCQLYDLPAEGSGQQKRAVGTTLNYFTDGTYFRQQPRRIANISRDPPPQQKMFERRRSAARKSPHSRPTFVFRRESSAPAAIAKRAKN